MNQKPVWQPTSDMFHGQLGQASTCPPDNTTKSFLFGTVTGIFATFLVIIPIGVGIGLLSESKKR